MKLAGCVDMKATQTSAVIKTFAVQQTPGGSTLNIFMAPHLFLPLIHTDTASKL